ncbi:MAG TPA: hypothetical protein VFW63_10530 [Acidimicrobiales bacterium]|nr:hypothetical protein [Acidimicrobiales bacterium]
MPLTRKRTTALLLLPLVAALVAALAAALAVRWQQGREDFAPAVTVAEEDLRRDASVAVDGNDFSAVTDAGRTAFVCDEEADENPVKARFSFESDRIVQVEDEGGADGTCHRLAVRGEPITNHQVCERNVLTWDCGGWDAVEPGA